MNPFARLAVVVLGLLLAVPAWAADPPPEEIPRFGTQAFRYALHKRGMEPLASVQELVADPSRSILIVLGDTSVLDRIPGGWEKFVKNGGAVMVATDQSWRGIVDGQKYKARSDTCYQGLPECPKLHPAIDAAPGMFRSPPRPGGGRTALLFVSTNLPSRLREEMLPREFRWQYLAMVPFSSPPERGTQLFGVTSDTGHGRAMILADHSVFINEMMVQPDTDNFYFALNCIAWLSEGDPKRDRVLLVEDDVIQSKFDVLLTEPIPPLPPLDALVPPLNSILIGLQNQTNPPNVFNRMIVPSRGAHLVWIAALTAVLVAGMMLYGVVWLGKVLHRRERDLPPLQLVLLPREGDQKPLQLRHRALLASGNLWEAARTLVRQELPQLVNEKPPRIRGPGGWWHCLKRQWRVDRLWRLASGSTSGHVSPADFAHLPGEIHALKSALARGTVRLE